MTTVDVRAHPRASRLAVTMAFVAQGVSLAILVTRIPAIKDRFDLSDGDLALYLVLVPVLAGVGSALAGVATARWHSSIVLRVSGPIVPLAVVGAGLADSPLLLAAALAFLGCAVGATDAAMNMQALALQRARQRPMVSACYAWYSLASIVGALLAAGAAAANIPLAAFFTGCAVIIVPLQLVAGAFLLPDVETSQGHTERRVPWAPVIVLGIALLAAYVLDSATQNWSAVFLSQALGSPESVAALGYAVYSLVLMVGRAGVDRVLPRLGPVVLVAAGAGLSIVALLVVALAPTATVALLGFGLLGLSLAPVIPLAFVAAASHDPGGTGRAVARVNIFNYLGILLGAPMIGVVAEFSSLRWSFALLIVAPIAILALAPKFRPASD